MYRRARSDTSEELGATSCDGETLILSPLIPCSAPLSLPSCSQIDVYLCRQLSQQGYLQRLEEYQPPDYRPAPLSCLKYIIQWP